MGMTYGTDDAPRGVALPEAGHSTAKPDTQQQTVVAVDARSVFDVNALPVSPAELAPRVPG
jgi:hypothetical protein